MLTWTSHPRLEYLRTWARTLLVRYLCVLWKYGQHDGHVTKWHSSRNTEVRRVRLQVKRKKPLKTLCSPSLQPLMCNALCKRCLEHACLLSGEIFPRPWMCSPQCQLLLLSLTALTGWMVALISRHSQSFYYIKSVLCAFRSPHMHSENHAI